MIEILLEPLIWWKYPRSIQNTPNLYFITRVRGTRIVVTLNLISELLHVPRVEFVDYPGCERLRTLSKDELSSLFCEIPSSWGDRQNTACSGFAKGPRFLNMVMTFVLHPLSHYISEFVITLLISTVQLFLN